MSDLDLVNRDPNNVNDHVKDNVLKGLYIDAVKRFELLPGISFKSLHNVL